MRGHLAIERPSYSPFRVREGWWWADRCLAPSDADALSHYLPAPLYDRLLQGDGRGTGRWSSLSPAELTFPSLESAQAALSRACVAHGRSLAGLGPLARPQAPGALT